MKAAFLYNVIKFIEWPAGARGPIIFGVLGKGPLEVHLQQVVRAKSLDGRPLIVKSINKLEDIKVCHVLFIADSESERLRDIVAALKDFTILTVSDIDQFARRGGMIFIVAENQKIRFEVNPDGLARAGVKISARFLQLAVIVRDHDREGRR
ncbi:MAG TPA: YfiR family protein [Bryobacteraceae bacterium]|nr:YfiR family protein [Bryobacteraceae bacterium]